MLNLVRVSAPAVIAAVALGGVACFDGGDASKTTEDLAAAMCDATFRCCERGEVDFFLGPFVDETNCIERLTRRAEIGTAAVIAAPFEGAAVVVPNIGVLQGAINDGRVAIDGAALNACIELLEGLSCNELIEEPEIEGCQVPEPEEENPCDPTLIVIGKVGEDGQCTSPGVSLECELGTVCRAVDSLGIDGVCVAPGEIGDFCFNSGECAEDLYCSLLDGTCQVPREAGETCLFAEGGGLLIECGENLTCDPITDTCVGACGRGASCFSDLECDEEAGLQCIVGRCDTPRIAGLPCQTSEHCAEGLRCGINPATGADLVCLEKLGDGEDCSVFAQSDCASGFCHPGTLVCSPTAAAGDVCPSFSQDECADSYCDTSPRLTFCDENADCVDSSGVCDLDSSVCQAFCIALQPDGAQCINGFECESGTCSGGFCRTTPLPDGQPCTFGTECASGFCNHEPTPVCEQLPLPNGRVCFFAEECASGVCHDGSCQNGLSEGADCSSFADPPCANGLFCDREQQPPLCVPVFASGEECLDSSQCHGDCVLRFNRRMCDATPPDDTAICDGQ
jgi:hypothetical protein